MLLLLCLFLGVVALAASALACAWMYTRRNEEGWTAFMAVLAIAAFILFCVLCNHASRYDFAITVTEIEPKVAPKTVTTVTTTETK